MIGTSQRGESMRVPWRVSIVAWMSLGRPGDGSRSEEGEVRSEEVGRFGVGWGEREQGRRVGLVCSPTIVLQACKRRGPDESDNEQRRADPKDRPPGRRATRRQR